MRNILKKDAMTLVWNGTSKVNENNNGGVALWSTPPSVHNAFNPAIFTRVKYYHWVDTYEPSFSVLPCYITIDNTDVALKFSQKTASSFYVECTTSAGVIKVMVYSGVTIWRMSSLCDSITSIDRIGFTEDDLTTDAIKDTSRVYIRTGQSYDDDRYICKDENNIIYRNDEVDTCSLTINPVSGDPVTLSAESFNGKTIFNASEVVKTLLNDALADFGTRRIMQDNALFTKYVVDGIGGTGSSYTFVGLNAVSQIGEEYDRTNDGGKVLTRLPALKWYDGYPLDYSVLSTETPTETANGIAPVQSITRVLVSPENEVILLDTDAETPVLTDNVVEIDLMSPMDIRVIRHCIPPKPFYVRWINDLGGVDYFMFARQQKLQPSVKSVSTFAPSVSDTLNARTNLRAYAISTDNTVTVGCSCAPAEHSALVRMPMSPLIEWYNQDTGRWIRLSVSKYDGSYWSKPETKTFEVTFSLPTINTQY